ncbi:MAG: hypothetical protein IIA82_05995 [Thaumarchaeota archaeon]|nr:hypothetical protein [Nitrososphaerota archaeon]
MKLNLQGKKLTIIVILIFSTAIFLVFVINWFDENVANPRIWKDWTCEEMKKFAIEFKDEQFTNFQRAKFHEALSFCMGT